MTPDEIRIAVAECCGLYVIYDAAGPKDRPDAWRTGYFTPKAASDRRKRWPSSAYVTVIPNYPASLDACAEMEKALDSIEGGWSLYTEYLEGGICATPLQRCEAFLRVKGKWKEATP